MEPTINLDQKFRITGPDIVAESIDGEVIIINLNSGAYYSSTGSGGRIWQALSHGLSIREAIALVSSEYEGDAASIQQDVQAFAAELDAEGLLEADADGSTPGVLPPGEEAGKQFEKPALNKYTDMQELLLLDPIHDIDPAVGWPFVKQAE